MTSPQQAPSCGTSHECRGFSARTLVAVALFSAAATAATTIGLQRRHAGSAPAAAAMTAKPQYQCPMHPTIVQDHPADCPVCGMKLVKVEPAAGSKGAPAAEAAAPQFLCPMHPSIVQDHPGDCPICGMKLVKTETPGGAKPGANSEAAAPKFQCPMHPTIVQDHAGDCPICGMKLVQIAQSASGHGESGSASGLSGLATIDIDPSRQQLIGLTTEPSAKGSIGGSWRTTGKVAIDETRVRRINIKVPGFVEKVFVDFVGKPVRPGEPLFSIYSPELLAAQEEFALAVRTRAELGAKGTMNAEGAALVAASRRKLQLWDIPDADIERIERTGEVLKALTLYSPIAGIVTKKDVVEGMKLDAGAMPYEIVDLSTVWVLADIYETELRFVKTGMPATLSLNAFPNRAFNGKVVFVDPLLDPQTRTVKIRLTFPNPTGDLRPEMFGEVVLRGKSRQGLRIPADSVIDSGTQKVVFVAVGQGKFQPREVRLGEADGQHVEVVEGLEAGEHVVTRANFLVDSESRLRASLAELSSAPTKKDSGARVLPNAAAASSQVHGEAPVPFAVGEGTSGAASGDPHAGCKGHGAL